MRVAGVGRWLFCSSLAGALLFPAMFYGQDSRSASVLVLKDPTPRPLDLDKVYAPPGGNPAGNPAVSPKAKKPESLYEQKKALMVRASVQIAALASTLDNAVHTKPLAASRAQEIQVAGLIELLAGNIHSSMVPPPSPKNGAAQQQGIPVVAGPPDTSAPLTSETAQLVSLAKELQDGVEKLSPETLSLGVIAKSSEVLQLAHTLKQRLDAP